MDKILRSSLRLTHIINWTDFFSWKEDFDNVNVAEVERLNREMLKNNISR